LNAVSEKQTLTKLNEGNMKLLASLLVVLLSLGRVGHSSSHGGMRAGGIRDLAVVVNASWLAVSPMKNGDAL
jgi:hypothetical protein